MDIDPEVKAIPKAELHVHIEGTVTPEMARKKAREHGMTLPDNIFSDDGSSYVWEDFLDCVSRVYDAAASTIRTKQDYQDITYDYLKRCANEGCIYVELIISPDHAARMGLHYSDMVKAIAAGIDKARDETGIEARMNVALVRHLPMANNEETTALILNYPHKYVTGIDLAGGEESGDIPAYAPLFNEICFKTNNALGIRLHAAEAVGPENGWDALALKATRIGHGVRAIEDEKLVKELVKREIVLEICPTSNVLAGIYNSYSEHPLRKLKDAGVKVTLSSDDPGLFGNSIGMEYQIARDEFGMSDGELLEMTRNSIEAAFVDKATRDMLMKKLDDYNSRDKKPEFKPLPVPQRWYRY